MKPRLGREPGPAVGSRCRLWLVATAGRRSSVPHARRLMRQGKPAQKSGHLTERI